MMTCTYSQTLVDTEADWYEITRRHCYRSRFFARQKKAIESRYLQKPVIWLIR